MTKDEDSYEESDSFMISDIKHMVCSELNPKNFVILSRDKPTFYLSSKRSEDILELLKALYQRHTKKKLSVYVVPKKNLKKFEVSQRDSVGGKYENPDDKYQVDEAQ